MCKNIGLATSFPTVHWTGDCSRTVHRSEHKRYYCKVYSCACCVHLCTLLTILYTSLNYYQYFTLLSSINNTLQICTIFTKPYSFVHYYNYINYIFVQCLLYSVLLFTIVLTLVKCSYNT